ncbi:MAG: DUF2147 domain-containing protein [Flavobacteriaceae bacterium]|jgi:uncharacterized protein (DUF2147 family)|tara:strand:- start:115 stop:546 length:432 start_codon:yes stop_codon:yes gene_type:complete
MKKILITILGIFFTTIGFSQTIFGAWNSFDEETNRLESVIEVYEKDYQAFAKITKITNLENQGATCINCSGKRKNAPILGMNILTGLQKEGDEWSGGKILDPKNGKEYKCYIQLLDENTLKIRGYIGFSVFGRTAIWKRATKQ